MPYKGRLLQGHVRVLTQALTAKSLSADECTLQCSWAYAAPEVLTYNVDPCDETFEDINLQSQDCWSLGCLLIWLFIGTDPFSMPVEKRGLPGDLDSSKLLYDLRQQQLAWVS